ncbi:MULTISPECIES: hypothetical protein [unclassified Clostridium]|uniref:hypothetical protein n=1 Tax=unclassified Clostridium TaxID=2614128 RepID=UPI0025C1226C|nr:MULTISPECIES: hypothetical protein [unclassified Clostridium]
MYKIKLEYFKHSGKFYTEEDYTTIKENMINVLDEIKNMKETGTLPGVYGTNWIIHVNADEHPNGYPLLIL